jgi:hypothetical protein
MSGQRADSNRKVAKTRLWAYSYIYSLSNRGRSPKEVFRRIAKRNQRMVNNRGREIKEIPEIKGH